MRYIIFFRGKNSSGNWVYGTLDNIDVPFRILFKNPERNNNVKIYDIDNRTVGQYTGLTDINGTKIFEGDICEITLFDPFGHDKQYIVKVVFEYGAFVFDNNGETIPFYMIDDFESDVEVIGNIYDNPELLDGGETNDKNRERRNLRT